MTGSPHSDQISIYLGQNTMLSFQREPGDPVYTWLNLSYRQGLITQKPDRICYNDEVILLIFQFLKIAFQRHLD